MMGIQVDDPTYIFGDNKVILVNSLVPDSVLKKNPIQLLIVSFVKVPHLMNGGQLTFNWKIISWTY